MYKLYQITNMINGKSYIGITKLSLEERWNIHLSHAKKPKYPLHNAIIKYGADAFTITLLEQSENRKLISELEEPTIQNLKTHVSQNGYNVAKGGYGGDLGQIAVRKRAETIKNWSLERKFKHKENLRKRNLGKTKENDLGRLSQSIKIKGNQFRKNISHAEEAKKKISAANKGKIRTPEMIENYKKAAKIRGAEHFKGKRISCICCKRDWDLGNFSQHLQRIKA